MKMPLSPNLGRRARAAGFTLVELLVVIVIIAVLAALLMPVLGGIIKKGYATTSANNLHQWFTAYAQSLGDNDGYMPSDGNPLSAGNQDAWYNRLPRLMSERPYSTLATAADKPTVGTRSVWINPAVSTKDVSAAGGGFVFHYGFNDKLSDAGQPMKAARVQNPHATILMGEKADASPSLNAQNVKTYFTSTDINSDPNGTANFVFVDGHGEPVKRSDFTNATATAVDALDEGQAKVSWLPYGDRSTK